MLTKCCCCISLRTGSVILGVLGLIGAIVTLCYSAGNGGYLTTGIIYFISHSFLLYGAVTNNYTAVLVYLVFTAIGILLDLIFGILIFASVGILVPALSNDCALILEEKRAEGISCDALISATVGTLASVFILNGILNIYFWICCWSFYKELKE